MDIEDYSSDYVPKDGIVIVGVDYGEDNSYCVVTGYYDPKTKAYHIQDITERLALAPE